MKEKKFIYFGIIFILSAIFLGIIIFQAYTINKLSASEENIVGTYTTGEKKGAEYITLERSGDCAVYTQFGNIKWGTYSKEDDVISMTFSDGTVYAVYINEHIYTFSEIYSN